MVSGSVTDPSDKSITQGGKASKKENKHATNSIAVSNNPPTPAGPSFRNFPFDTPGACLFTLVLCQMVQFVLRGC